MPTLDPKAIPIGLAWCREENYDAFVAIFKDSEKFPATWKQFITPSEKAEQFLEMTVKASDVFISILEHFPIGARAKDIGSMPKLASCSLLRFPSKNSAMPEDSGKSSIIEEILI